MGLKGWEKNPKIVKADLEQNGGRKMLPKVLVPDKQTQKQINSILTGGIFTNDTKPKYGYDGYAFRNEGEYLCYLELKARQDRGEIRNLGYETMKFKLIDAKITNGKARWYTPDYTFQEWEICEHCEVKKVWCNVAVDYKGGNVYALKKWNEVAELFRLRFPGWELREMK